MNYYNENDKNTAAWLCELIAEGLTAPGDVDTRSIEDITPGELDGYTQCHFFAGIGGWSYALRLAGWPDDRPVWTGSCPCQPFSSAGQRKGTADNRHLWPAFHWLIEQCRPAIVFGEQVASKAADQWLDIVSADLEGLGFAVGAIAFPAAGIGAPHIRDRTYWVGHRLREGLEGFSWHEHGQARREEPDRPAPPAGGNGGVGRSGSQPRQRNPGGISGEEAESAGPRGPDGGFNYRHTDAGEVGHPGPTNGFWRVADWLLCRDGKWRPVRPGTFPLVDGLPRGVVPSGDICFPTAEARQMRIKGYGNAIVPQQAAAFISAVIN